MQESHIRDVLGLLERMMRDIRHLIAASILLTSPAFAGESVHRFGMADGTVDGTLIGAYEKTWQQCALQDGKWLDSGAVTESAIKIGSLLRHRQSTQRPDGVRSIATTYFEHASFAPLRMELLVFDADGNQLVSAQRELGSDGYTGKLVRGNGESQDVGGSVSSRMFHGGALGLPLATLDYTADAYEFDASMMMFDAHYAVIATIAGTEQIDYEGGVINLRLVDVEWRHDNGDIYPAGPDEGGGRFWLLAEDSDELPYVIRYKTDSYAVEFLPGVCAIAEYPE